MGNDERTITAATVTITVELFDLGTYGPGSSVDQARHGAAAKLTQLLGMLVQPDHIRVDAVLSKPVTGRGSCKFERLGK